MTIFFLDFFDLTTKNFNPNRGDFPESESEEEYDEEDEQDTSEIVKKETIKEENIENLSKKLENV
jgi:hypothetical protein